MNIPCSNKQMNRKLHQNGDRPKIESMHGQHFVSFHPVRVHNIRLTNLFVYFEHVMQYSIC